MKDTSSSETWMRFCARNAVNGPVLRMMPLSAKIAKTFGVIAVLIEDHARNLFHAVSAQTFPRLIVGNASQLARHSPAGAEALTVGIIAAVGILSTARSATLPYARAACRFTIMIVRILRTTLSNSKLSRTWFNSNSLARLQEEPSPAVFVQNCRHNAHLCALLCQILLRITPRTLKQAVFKIPGWSLMGVTLSNSFYNPRISAVCLGSWANVPPCQDMSMMKSHALRANG